MALKKKVVITKKGVTSNIGVTPSSETNKQYKSLDDVIDRTKLFSMFYSGVETEDYFNTIYNMGIRDFLISYHYCKKVGDSHQILNKGKDMRLMIDSGAFTYQVDEKFHNYTVEQWEVLIKEYLEWLEAHKNIIFAAANLDLQTLVGIEQVKEWNRKYFEPFMLRTGIPICFVWHLSDGYDALEYMCKRYPFVGVSWASDDISDGMKIMRIAEKHDCLIHGFGMTQTKQLTKLPLFTCDSTSWQAGLRYGEMNFWRGTRMSRLKKEQWQGEYLEKIINACSEEGYDIDKKKLLAEEYNEVVIANVVPFLQATKYIREKLRTKMYWLKPKSVKRDIDSVEFPPDKWIIDKEEDNWEEYARNLNINPEPTEVGLILDTIVDVSVILQWDKESLREFRDSVYTEELITTLHDTYINRIVPDVQTKINDLQEFFTNCVTGLDDTLLLLGGDFQTKAREREHYIEEEDYEYQEISREGVISKLFSAQELPSGEGAPDLDALEDEVFKEKDIIPVRDEKGRFLKGQQKVRKPKNIYSEKFPKLICDTCYGAQTCPEYKAGMVCAYNKLFNKFDTRNSDDILDAMTSLANLNLQRTQRAAMFEMLDGGVIDGNVSLLIDQNIRLMNNILKLKEAGMMQTVSRSVTIKQDGSTEETLRVSTNATKEGGILEKLLTMNNKKESKYNEEKIIEEVDALENNEE